MDPTSLIANPYEQLHIYYLEGTPEAVPDGFHDLGYIGNWEEEGFSFLFFSLAVDYEVEQLVKADDGLTLVDSYQMTCEEWHGDAIESYTAGSLCISPPWKIPFVNQPGIKHILLDPGVVFGTGRHPTTEACLHYIEQLCAREKIETVLDIGTGTGLLAMGAAALGCRRVLALDFNLLAVKTTLNNVRLNSFEDRILPIQAKAQDYMEFGADLVVANIHFDVMKDLIDNPGFLAKPWFILSGLLRSEAEQVLAVLGKRGALVLETTCPDGVWTTIFGKGIPV
ncbi:MAG: methyltransferase [Desulfobacteraceae bacterium]|nr:methyltransferase [Desulfobacteraceae bacterium]